MTKTPFTDEDNLPPFEHGSRGLSYFQVLRTLLSKNIRATIHLQTLKEHNRRHQIPKGLRIIKSLNAVEPTHQLKIEYMQILGQAENQMMSTLIQHYNNALPKIEEEFRALFTQASNSLTPFDRRLMVIKLAHFKNDLIEERTSTAQNKMSNNQTNPNNQTNQDNQSNRDKDPNGAQRQIPSNSNWDDRNLNEWDSGPKPQRSRKQFRGKRGGRGRGRGRY
jgi:hypothetical protein